MRASEFQTMRAVSVAAFEGDASIGRLLDALHSSWAWADELSFVAECHGEIVGQVLYTRALLDAPDRLIDVLVLSPVGVQPGLHQRGIGTSLITESLASLTHRTEPVVFLEGHPSYYPRFGFRRAVDHGFIAPSVRIPADAFMMYPLPSYEPTITGALVYPDAFWRTDAVGLR
jgi:putative acetyltransferase